MRKRVTYRPSKAQSLISAVASGIFVLIGIVIVIPTFGLFGVFWTLLAAVGAVMSAYRAFGKGYLGPEIHIEDEGDRAEQTVGPDVKSRLEQLKSLRSAGLVDEEEYQEKRREILEQL